MARLAGCSSPAPQAAAPTARTCRRSVGSTQSRRRRAFASWATSGMAGPAPGPSVFAPRAEDSPRAPPPGRWHYRTASFGAKRLCLSRCDEEVCPLVHTRFDNSTGIALRPRLQTLCSVAWSGGGVIGPSMKRLVKSARCSWSFVLRSNIASVSARRPCKQATGDSRARLSMAGAQSQGLSRRAGPEPRAASSFYSRSSRAMR